MSSGGGHRAVARLRHRRTRKDGCGRSCAARIPLPRVGREEPQAHLSPLAHNARLSWKLLLLDRLLRQTRINLNVLGLEPGRYSPAESYRSDCRGLNDGFAQSGMEHCNGRSGRRSGSHLGRGGQHHRTRIHPAIQPRLCDGDRSDTVTVGGRSQAGGVTITGVTSQRDRVLNQRIDQQAQEQSEYRRPARSPERSAVRFRGSDYSDRERKQQRRRRYWTAIDGVLSKLLVPRRGPIEHQLANRSALCSTELGRNVQPGFRKSGSAACGTRCDGGFGCHASQRANKRHCRFERKDQCRQPERGCRHARRSATVRYPAVIAARRHPSDNERRE